MSYGATFSLCEVSSARAWLINNTSLDIKSVLADIQTLPCVRPNGLVNLFHSKHQGRIQRLSISNLFLIIVLCYLKNVYPVRDETF